MAHFRSWTQPIDATTIKVNVEWQGAPIEMHEAFTLLASQAEFRNGVTDALCTVPFDAYFWEMPPAVKGASRHRFEFALTNAPALQRVAPEVRAFEEHFSKGSHGVVSFENLGGDATLIVPCPLADHTSYTHLATFVRNAPREQVHALFTAVGEAAARRLSDRPQWLSTAGMGVYWLHVRLDSRPKYYRFIPYKTAR